MSVNKQLKRTSFETTPSHSSTWHRKQRLLMSGIDESAAGPSSSTSAKILSGHRGLDLRRNWLRHFLDFRPWIRFL